MDENKERSLVAKVMDGLVSGIVEQKYGAILPPQDILSKEFDVSRTVMREALSHAARPRHAGRAAEDRHAHPADERLADDRRGCRELALSCKARSDVSSRCDRVPHADRAARGCAGRRARGSPAEIAGIRDAFDASRACRSASPNIRPPTKCCTRASSVASGNQFFQPDGRDHARRAGDGQSRSSTASRRVREATLAAQRRVVEAIEAERCEGSRSGLRSR